MCSLILASVELITELTTRALGSIPTNTQSVTMDEIPATDLSRSSMLYSFNHFVSFKNRKNINGRYLTLAL